MEEEEEMEFMYDCAATATVVVTDVAAALTGTTGIQAFSHSVVASEVRETTKGPADGGRVDRIELMRCCYGCASRGVLERRAEEGSVRG